MKKTSATSRFFREARQAPKSSASRVSSSLSSPTPSLDGVKAPPQLPSPAEMEAANVRALQTRGRLKYSRRAIARRRDELGETSATPKTGSPAIDAARLPLLGTDWIRHCKMDGHSPRTTGAREIVIERFLWFVSREGFARVGASEIEAYLLHLREGHTQPGGRFGLGGQNPKCLLPLLPASHSHHHTSLAAWFSWQVKRGYWNQSPFQGIQAPHVPEDSDVLPLSDAEFEAILAGAKKSFSPLRDRAILWFLLDTGLRAAELCSLTFGDLDENTRAVEVMGKGKKRRIVYYGNNTAKALWKHISDVSAVYGEEARGKTSPLFASERGSRAGMCLQPRALHALISRLGTSAGVAGAHPHRFRHTFAVNFLKKGGNQISLMRFLGHTDLTMTKRYVQFVEADLEEQHRKFSPGDRLRG